ncbi:LOW QUALITY PROTEIN: hypothetical protein SETIT_7G241900v2 [Setaria italica]|uniref:Uncharacterized protein n=1 Tax=Setaria italica TaxID=4555 RepID=A0A368RZ23_SETIT|nr:LOW QUALITY PROTEIN: hypothetical protein SETIT_7G241900v2 [Setaria italica]
MGEEPRMTSEVFEQLLHVGGLVVAPVQRGGGRHHGRGRRPQQRHMLRPVKKACAFTSAAPLFDPSREPRDQVARRGVVAPAAVGGGGGGELERAAHDVAERGLAGLPHERGAPVDELVEEHAAHQSTAAPCPPPCATSGATYSCVPTKELDRASTGSATNRGRGAADDRRFHRRRWRSCSSGIGRHVGAPSPLSRLLASSSAGDAVDSSDRSKSVLEGEEHLGGVEPRGGEREAAARHAVVEGVEVAAGAELHDDAREIRAGVEVRQHGGQERVVEPSENASMQPCDSRAMQPSEPLAHAVPGASEPLDEYRERCRRIGIGVHASRERTGVHRMGFASGAHLIFFPSIASAAETVVSEGETGRGVVVEEQ